MLQVLKASPQLLELLKAVEADTARYTSQAGRRPEGPYADVLPFIVDQRQDWESFATVGQTQAPPQVPRHLERQCVTLLKTVLQPRNLFDFLGGPPWRRVAACREGRTSSAPACLGRDRTAWPQRPGTC